MPASDGGDGDGDADDGGASDADGGGGDGDGDGAARRAGRRAGARSTPARGGPDRVVEAGGAGGGILSRPVLAWALWDWGASAFTAVITTFVFTVYLTSASFGPSDETSAALGVGLSVAGIAVALLAPVLGQSADRAGRGTFWLGVHTVVVVLLSGLLYFVRPDPAYLWLGVVLVAAGNVFVEFANVNYSAMLARISTPATIGRISGFGWGFGYLGGIALLLVVVVGFVQPEVGWFGVTRGDGANVRVAMLLAAAWFAVFAVPVLLVVRDARAPREREPSHRRGPVAAYRELGRTLRTLWREDRRTLHFLAAAAVYRDGLAGVFTFGGVLAAGSFGFGAGSVIAFGIAANVVAGIATIASGVLDDRLGPKRVIVVSLGAMTVAGLGLFFFHAGGPTVFWVLGLVLCVFVGPAQSASRSCLARLVPAHRHGQVFGLYATAGRAASFLAPMLFSAAIWLGDRLRPGQDVQYWGILGIMAVLATGLALVWRVPLPAPGPPGSGPPGSVTAGSDTTGSDTTERG